MARRVAYDAVVVGAGPNGLSAAVRLAHEGLSVLLVEANAKVGGAARSEELTLPGFVHDVCSAIHPLGLASPFFRRLPLAKYGLSWIHPEIPLAHPLENDSVLLHRSIDTTADGLGKDSSAYLHLFSPMVSVWENLVPEILQPVLHIPRHPLQMARFGARAIRSAERIAKRYFQEQPAQALFAGLAAHSFLRLEQAPSAAFGLVLGLLAHGVGWPMPRGGSQQIADALAAHLRALGGEIAVNHQVHNLDQLPLARTTLLDITPRQFLRLAGEKLPASARRRYEAYRYGPGVFKMDYALSGPVPWRDTELAKAGTVHIGGTLNEVSTSEREVTEGKLPQWPFLLFVQPTLFDASRAPKGKHIAWVYCHVPNGSDFDMTERIENQIERFAPGFRDLILRRHVRNCSDMERRNANLVGGDINGGLADFRQLVARPVFSLRPYATPLPAVYLCSSSTPPGGGVHGMCGFHAAEAALRDCFGKKSKRREHLPVVSNVVNAKE
jgi:phytoene dehydrogenase-like protein